MALPMIVNMIVKTTAAIVLLCLCPQLAYAQTPDAPHVGYAVGSCGGQMTGYDGRQYACNADRLPVCDAQGQRCVCLAQRQCGASRDEPY